MTQAYVILACVLPTTVYATIIYWVDRYEKEPFYLLFLTFFWGAAPSILLTIFLMPIAAGMIVGRIGIDWTNYLQTIILAPTIEEIAKALVLIAILIWWSHEVDSWLDGIIYGAIAGLGFAMVENYFYFVHEFELGGWAALRTNVFFRAGAFGLNHAFFTSLTGLGVGMASLTNKRSTKIIAPTIGIIAAIGVHALHNILVTASSGLLMVALIADWTGVALIFVIIVWALTQERLWLRHYLREEVLIGTLTMRQYENAFSVTKRSPFLWRVLLSQGLRRYLMYRDFFHQCSKLASLKHHLDVHPEDLKNIAAMRMIVYRLGKRI